MFSLLSRSSIPPPQTLRVFHWERWEDGCLRENERKVCSTRVTRRHSWGAIFFGRQQCCMCFKKKKTQRRSATPPSWNVVGPLLDFCFFFSKERFDMTKQKSGMNIVLYTDRTLRYNTSNNPFFPERLPPASLFARPVVVVVVVFSCHVVVLPYINICVRGNVVCFLP